jgi:hypothetical protein
MSGITHRVMTLTHGLQSLGLSVVSLAWKQGCPVNETGRERTTNSSDDFTKFAKCRSGHLRRKEIGALRDTNSMMRRHR